MADLIDRAAAIEIARACERQNGPLTKSGETDYGKGLSAAGQAIAHAIAALPAQGVRVRPLEWIDFEGRGAKAQAWSEANYMIQRWSDGRYEINASYPGYGTFIEGTDRFYPTLNAAKAAAQADYERRILAALAPAEAGGVDGRPDAPCHIV